MSQRPNTRPTRTLTPVQKRIEKPTDGKRARASESDDLLFENSIAHLSDFEMNEADLMAAPVGIFNWLGLDAKPHHQFRH